MADLDNTQAGVVASIVGMAVYTVLFLHTPVTWAVALAVGGGVTLWMLSMLHALGVWSVGRR